MMLQIAYEQIAKNCIYIDVLMTLSGNLRPFNLSNYCNDLRKNI